MSKLISTGTLSTFYDGIKDSIKDEEDRAKAVEESLQTAINNKSDNGHSHNDLYYTEDESSKNFVSWNRGAYDIDDRYDGGIWMCAQGANMPSGYQYGVALTLPYRKLIGNDKPDFCGQIYIPNGDDNTSSDSLFFRTSLTDSWREWQEVATKNDINDISNEITSEETRAKAEEGALAERISTVETNKADANDLNRYQLIQDDALQTANKRIPDAINELQSEIIDEVSRAKAEEQALSRSIDTLSSNKADTNALNSYQLIQDNALDTSNKRIPDAINELKSAIDSNKTDVNSKISGINTSITNIENKNNNQDSEITTLKNNVSDITTRLAGITLKQVTQAQYDAITNKDANTLYIIIQ